MKSTIDWINEIIGELVDPKIKLQDTLLKVQVLSHKVKNEKLKEWIESESNGYSGLEVPEYRIIPVTVRGNISYNDFRSISSYTDRVLSIEYVKNKETRKALQQVSIGSSVSALQHMLGTGAKYSVPISPHIQREIAETLNGWHVDSAWQSISLASFEGIINSIKTHLLKFLLDFADEIGENNNIEFMKDKKKIDSLFEKTIGSINSDNVNINFGGENVNSISTGENAKNNIAIGEKIEQTINIDVKEEISNFIQDLRDSIDKLQLSLEDSEDINNEITRVETQIQRHEPKYLIINEGLKVIYNILIGVAGNAFSAPILDKLSFIMGQIGS